MLDYFDEEDLPLTYEERHKKYQGKWPDGKSEIDRVCCGCAEIPSAFCVWNGKYYRYCLTCKSRISFAYAYKWVRHGGYTKATVVQVPDSDWSVFKTRDRGPKPKRIPKNVQALRALPYVEYLQSEHWKKTRESSLERGGRRCASCGSRWYLQVHHLYYGNLGCENPNDLQVLCKSCHEEEHRDSIEFRKACGLTTTVLGLPIT